MKFKRLDIPDIILCEPSIHNDNVVIFQRSLSTMSWNHFWVGL